MKRVLVTRAPHQASALADALVAHGFEVISIPTIKIVPPADGYKTLDAALRRLETFDWLLFTSANAVEVFAARLQETRLAVPETISVAVIGTATAASIRAIGMDVDLVPERAIAESLAEALSPYAADTRILWVRAEEAREVLSEKLRAAGAEVTIATAYRTVVATESADLLRAEIASLDAVTFTSASSVRNFYALLQHSGEQMPAHLALASIGPVTSAELRQHGAESTIEAAEANVNALADAVASILQ